MNRFAAILAGPILLLALVLAPAHAFAAGNPFDAHVRPVNVGDGIPSTRFVDQDGRHLTLRDSSGRTVVLSFIYTRCTDECPLVTQKFVRLRDSLSASKFVLALVSIDPAHDTPVALRRYARHHGADAASVLMLTGRPADVLAFARSLGVSTLDNGRGEILHNNRTIIVGPDGAVADTVDESGWSPRELAAQARHIAQLRSDPMARFDLALGKAVAAVCGGSQFGRSGLTDLLAIFGIFAASAAALYWVTRKLFLVSP
ncbi:MAG: SCO family protein [Candidatus Eremiobacteraeota bacterium]|nr:SCO family protein [Candidatus Eremiobacteraeota bacterium]MBC5827131.1 SCO family protein [Candidatus Eremiobacteraeota bacterium]